MVDRYPDSPMAPDALVSLARTYSSKGQIDQAMACYQRYLADYTSEGQYNYVLLELGMLYEGQGQLDIARDLYRGYLNRAGPSDRRYELIRARLGALRGKSEGSLEGKVQGNSQLKEAGHEGN